MFFCHEMNFACRWLPVVYYESKPRPLTDEFAHRRTKLDEVPADCLTADGRPDLDALGTRFPAPVAPE